MCGIIGVHNNPEASVLSYLGMYALQHRGQESAGIVSTDGNVAFKHHGMGLVADVFSDRKILENLKGGSAIGHNRYSTTGGSHMVNVQPLLFNYRGGKLAISHNGNLVNIAEIRDRLINNGALFQTTSDTEIIMHLIAHSDKDTLVDRTLDAFRQVQGAYSLLILTEDELIAARDPHGFRPLCMGKLGETTIFASESCAFDLIGAEYIRDIEPGELVSVNNSGLQSYEITNQIDRRHCVFEYVYFSRPDSRIYSDNVDKTRRKLGKNLAHEAPCPNADIVISVPDSSNTAALGYARESGLRFELGLIRNHYVGRTFIHPTQTMRDTSVRIKFNTVEGVLNGKKVVVVEDSIVRGTTLKSLTKLLRESGAAEVHIRVSSPPIKHPCFYGLDFPERDSLIANNMSIEEMRTFLNVDSLQYLSIEGMITASDLDPDDFCHACFSGDYPVSIRDEGMHDKTRYESEPEVAAP
ncbi:MAG: amidophosphoribosyltransferase [Candidatus Marinimicrobia bacterium]|nr:amidophosphoribosyltransferase [Candidatus Neomarinimicrobiota bacterium]MCF7828090.1 amidophosphoribosyltransferase [Candidatus Neomarinimicrobiota bacterium]MCF7879735.1 amidophosphoribosyltransferase [Candidatus Neomarinimicrobiota bacterium]